jgi:hypothetical protein
VVVVEAEAWMGGGVRCQIPVSHDGWRGVDPLSTVPFSMLLISLALRRFLVFNSEMLMDLMISFADFAYFLWCFEDGECESAPFQWDT